MRTPEQRYLRTTPRTGAEFHRDLDVWRLLRLDPVLFMLLVLLACLGLLSLYSASGADVGRTVKQASSFAIGFGVLLVMARIPPTQYLRLAPFLYAGGTFLLLLVEVIGDVRMGAQRWLSVPGLGSVQPSEFLKLGMPLMIAHYLSARTGHEVSLKDLLVSLGLLLVPVLLILKQPDLGTAILVFLAGFFVIFLAGLPWRILIGFGGLVLALIPVAWPFLHDYQRRRVLTLFNPEADHLGAGWNIIQSKTAIGSGGLLGKGRIEGTQSHLHFLPEGHTDFLIAAYAEELGFLGVIALMGLYLAVLWRCLHIARHAQTAFTRLLAGAITLSFFTYVFVNVGMVSGILPVVGVPLPLMSYGGTAIISLMAGFGLLMSIHAHRKIMG